MVQRVRDPEPESGFREEYILLAQGVELRIPIQDAGGDELVKDADNERRQDGENDVMQGQRPRLVGNLPREVIEERVLHGMSLVSGSPSRSTVHLPRIVSCRARYSCRTNLGHSN